MAWTVGGTPPDMNPTTVKRIQKPKAPMDVIPITIDFHGALAAIDDDTLQIAIPATISIIRNDDGSNDLQFVPPAQFSTDATRITLWFAQGSIGFEYRISITAISVFGQTLERSFLLPVNYR